MWLGEESLLSSGPGIWKYRRLLSGEGKGDFPEENVWGHGFVAGQKKKIVTFVLVPEN